MRIYRVGIQQEYNEVKDFLYFTSKNKAAEYMKQCEDDDPEAFVEFEVLEFELTRKDICRMLNKHA